MRYVLLLTLLFMSSSVLGFKTIIYVKIQHVIDGDTFIVKRGSKRYLTGLVSVNALELDEPNGENARIKNMPKNIILEYEKIMIFKIP